MNSQQEQQLTKIEEKAGWMRPAGRAFSGAFRSTWPYVTGGVVFGLGLLYTSYYLVQGDPDAAKQHPGLLALIAEHLGLGFIVAAIAVFFYEWGAHHKYAMDLSKQLADLIECQADMAVRRGLEKLLPDGGSSARIRRAILGIVKDTTRLTRGDIRFKQGFVESLMELLEAVRGNTESLGSLGASHGQHDYRLGGKPTTDRVLALQMQNLQKGDEYRVLSHLASWVEGRLQSLQKESIDALGRGVAVQRIFNLTRQGTKFEESAARAVLERHAELAKPGGNYEARVITAEVLHDLEADLVYYLEGRQEAYFCKEDSVLGVKIEDPSLTELKFSIRPEVDENWGEAWKYGKVLYSGAPPAQPGITVDECLKSLENAGLLKQSPPAR